MLKDTTARSKTIHPLASSRHPIPPRNKKATPSPTGRTWLSGIKPPADCDGGVAARRAQVGPCWALAVCGPGSRYGFGTSDGIADKRSDSLLRTASKADACGRCDSNNHRRFAAATAASFSQRKACRRPEKLPRGIYSIIRHDRPKGSRDLSGSLSPSLTPSLSPRRRT